MSNKAIHVWKGMWLALTLEIWNYRNRIIFYIGQLDKVETFTRAQWQA